jgi:predicted lipoprotein with Yx(FWY)xxD motif
MNKKILIVGVIVVLVLIIGGGTVYFLLGRNEAQESVDVPRAGIEIPSIKVATHATLGSYLTDANGRTLYVFIKDSANTSTCEAECLAKWPVFSAGTIKADESLSGGDFNTIVRKDGMSQTTFKTYPLYYYSGDKIKGDVAGQGLGNVWYIMDPAKDPAALKEGGPVAAVQQIYTLADITLHGTPENCWLAIGGKVYDVTQIITDRKHPGGAPIVQGCGKDATSLFETRPMGSNTPHSEAARTWLTTFYIGDLK